MFAKQKLRLPTRSKIIDRNIQKTSEATVVLQTPSLRGWGVEKMFVTNSLTGEVWVNLVGSNDLKGEEWVNLS